MNISYITHSCLLVELDSCYLPFGHYRGTLPRIKEDKPLYVFASHAYVDYHSTRVSKLRHPSIAWILSSDIVAAHLHIQAEAGKCYTVNDLQACTLASADEGVAFLVIAKDNCIYHADDLDWQDQGDENTPQEHVEVRERYFREL